MRIDFWAVESYSEAPEVEGEGDVGGCLELGPACAVLGCAVYAAQDDHGAGGEGEVCGEEGGGVCVVEEGGGVARGGRVLTLRGDTVADVGAGACGADVAEEGGRSGGAGVGTVRARNIYMCGLLVVGEAEDEAEVAVGESALGVVLVEARDAGHERAAQGVVGVVGRGVVDDVGDECEGEWRVHAVSAAVAYAAQPSQYAGNDVVFVAHV